MKATDRYDSLFQFYGEVYDIPWKLLKAQGLAESELLPDALSHVGAKGLTQFMDPTFKEWAGKLQLVNPNVWNPEHAIACQAAYMRWLLDRFKGDVNKALAAYNFGIGNVQKGLPWPKETIDYVEKITKSPVLIAV